MKRVHQTRIYLAPFHATTGESSSSPCSSTIAAFKSAVSREDWPYDNGDDPSFYAMRKFGGQLSWGVCRQDVRNNIRPDDIVVFFSFRKFEETGDSEYRLCALASVDRKVSQIDLWKVKNLRIYANYFNLLIKPSKSARDGWEHFEPALEGSRVHRDWLWRIADHRGFRKKEFDKLEAIDHFQPGGAMRGRSLVIARNYVIFSSDPAKTHVLSKPPVVAWHSKGKPSEQWSQDRFSQAVRRIMLEVAARANGRQRSLRIKNSQRAHRHIVFELAQPEAQAWRSELLNLIKDR
ncbi:MAG: hypothetical protein ACRD50_02840 [Candidatus Acidiferrales bacterium]